MGNEMQTDDVALRCCVRAPEHAPAPALPHGAAAMPRCPSPLRPPGQPGRTGPSPTPRARPNPSGIAPGATCRAPVRHGCAPVTPPTGQALHAPHSGRAPFLASFCFVEKRCLPYMLARAYKTPLPSSPLTRDPSVASPLPPPR
jgi:hypothetical protein